MTAGTEMRPVADLLEIVLFHDMVYFIVLKSFVLQAQQWTCFGRCWCVISDQWLPYLDAKVARWSVSTPRPGPIGNCTFP